MFVPNHCFSCVAPDYILCTNRVAAKLVPHFDTCMREWYGSHEMWNKTPDLARIVNRKHYNRLLHLIKSATGTIVMGGEFNEDDLWIKPTVILGVKHTDPIMNEEVFGPVLPVTIRSLGSCTFLLDTWLQGVA